ncbi:MAG TPA: amylo-alpha-1,6-glucosidase [Myxococcota bacterium]|nr:amylo-alpha-1,6-glucosidase [Myxococcota bacterium]
MTDLDEREWLEPDGLGGFASGTVCGVRTRRYHALLLAATTPPTGRMVLVNGLEAWVTTPIGVAALSAQRYAPGVVHPDGADRIAAFAHEPWPTWRFRLPGGIELEQEILVRHGAPAALVAWRLVTPAASVRLSVRPLLSGRDYHALQHENPVFDFAPRTQDGERLRFAPYPGVPEIELLANARYEHAPEWYRRFEYGQELARGLDGHEDLASPGVLHFDLSAGRAVLLLASAGALEASRGALAHADALRADERKRREELAAPLRRAADAYLVRRGTGRTIVAGYPWFTDWGRDTFIALRGLCLATGRLDEAGRILAEWSGAVSQGMLPNRFPDAGEAPEYNAVDASLWFVVAAGEYLRRRRQAPERERLQAAIEAILAGYARGTRFGIRADRDGLLAAGVPGQQLTWMDARVGDRVVTPRIGKPVEVQALWLNALAIAAEWRPALRESLERGRAAFQARFWNEAEGALYDVVDVDHVAGSVDPSFRPNQLFAVGGLPLALLEGERARRLVDAVESRLWTPLGPRTLAPGSPSYAPRFAGGPSERDAAYHQGTAWPWLAGAFVEAWLRVRGNTAAARRAARERFLPPLEAALGAFGLGHLPEVADAEAPHRPGGCPFQAWSLGELIRLREEILS